MIKPVQTHAQLIHPIIYVHHCCPIQDTLTSSTAPPRPPPSVCHPRVVFCYDPCPRVRTRRPSPGDQQRHTQLFLRTLSVASERGDTDSTPRAGVKVAGNLGEAQRLQLSLCSLAVVEKSCRRSSSDPGAQVDRRSPRSASLSACGT
jgi:hypothetical protein